jgi:hypothetical protein
MAAGKRYKFQGSEIAVLTGFEDASPAIAITAITKANPAMVTASGHGLVEGQVVKITGVIGMTEVNDDLFIVGEVTGASFALADVDSTDYGAYTSGGSIAKGVLSNFCELTNYNRQGGTSPELPASSLCSVAQEYELGLPDFGTTALDFNFAPRTAIQTALHEFYLSGDKTAVYVNLPKSGGQMVQLGFLQQESETAGVGALWTASATIRNTGNRFDIAAA